MLAGTLVLVGCGGSTDTAPAAPAAPAPAPTTPQEVVPEPLAPIRALFATRYAVPSAGDVAEPLGFWTELGLDVELFEGQEAVEVLLSGDMDIAITSPSRFAGAIVSGADIVILGPTGLVWDQYIIVRSDLGINTIDEFKAYGDANLVRYGISRIGAAGHYGAQKVAEELGWVEAKNYELAILGNLDGIRAAFQAGQIDWFVWSAGGALGLEASGEGVLIGNTADLIPPTGFNVIAASRKAINEKPASIRAFCEGYYKGQRWAKENPFETAEIFINEGGQSVNTTLRVVLDGIGYLSDDDKFPDTAWDVIAEATVFTLDGLDSLTGDEVRAMYVPCSEL